MTDKIVKYFRTFHLPWSESVADDDIVRTSPFDENSLVVVSLKVDGESSSAYPSGRTHARSIDSVNHPSRNYLKSYWAERCYQLPEGWRVCGENLFAKHSIFYTDLESYFYVYSIWDENNNCLSVDDTKEWCTLLDLVHVPIIYTGIYDEKLIKQSFLPHKEKHEGYVIRTAGSFHYDNSSENIAKYVRKNHIQSTEHWLHQEIVPNLLKVLTTP